MRRGECRDATAGSRVSAAVTPRPLLRRRRASWSQEPVLERVVYEDIPANLSALKHRAEQVKFQHRIQELEAQGGDNNPPPPPPPSPLPCPCSMHGFRTQSDAARRH